MPFASFTKLVEMIRAQLVVDESQALRRGGAILPEIYLYLTLRYCAGGSHSDIYLFTGISKPSFYRCLWLTIDAINNTPALDLHFPQTPEECEKAARGFQSISSNNAITNVVNVVDGFHMQTPAPSRKDVENVRAFFSGHYQTYGVNVQASCDHNCRFGFIGVAGPGVMGDREALNQVSIGKMMEKLRGVYCVIGDCAYTPTEHLVPIFRGENARIPCNDNFNYYASQCRIRIEMAFGLMVKKWGILSSPLKCKLQNIKRLIVAIARLHNFCIDERLEAISASLPSNGQAVYTPTDSQFDMRHTQLRVLAAEDQFSEMVTNFAVPWSHNRDRMAKEIELFGLTRPGR